MKLLYITNGITGSAGLERVLAVKTSLLANNFGYDVHLLTLNEINKEPFYSFSQNISIYSIAVGGDPFQYFKQYKKGIQNIVDEIKPDIISVCDDGLKGFFLPQLIRTKAKWIYERHVSTLIDAAAAQSKTAMFKKIVNLLLMRKLGKNFKKFVVLTQGNASEWPGFHNLVVIPNPLPFVSEMASTLHNKTVICVGKISYQKGQDLLLKVWGVVHDKYPEWQLRLYGREDLEFVDTRKLKNNVFYFPAAKDIQSNYLESSILVLPSRFEGFGMVLIEAMECGLPCVSFDCNYGPGDIINNNEDGILAKNGDIQDLANQIMKLIGDDELRKTMGQNAKQNVKRFSPEKIAARWDQLFKFL